METSTPSSNVRTWNVLCHASALAGFFVPWAGHILGPLIVWLAKRGDSAEIDEHGKESLNRHSTFVIVRLRALSTPLGSSRLRAGLWPSVSRVLSGFFGNGD